MNRCIYVPSELSVILRRNCATFISPLPFELEMHFVTCVERKNGQNAECWEQSDLPRHARLVYCSHISLDVNTYFCCEKRKHSIRPNLAGSMKLRSNS